MAAHTSFPSCQAFDLPDSNESSRLFPNSDTAEDSTLNPDHLVQSSGSEDRSFVNDFADNVLDAWDEYEDLSCSSAQDNPFNLESFALHGNGDSTSLDPWSEALSSSFDLLPNLQTDSPLLDLFQDSCTTESLMPWEETIPSSNAVSITPGNSYRPTPDLTECSTPTCLSITDGFHDPPVRNSGSFDTENQRWHGTSIPESFPFVLYQFLSRKHMLLLLRTVCLTNVACLN